MKKFDNDLLNKQGEIFLQDDWLIIMSRLGLRCIEVAPANKCYAIYTNFHPNGTIKMHSCAFGSAFFGSTEYYDEKGNLERVVNEDLKFGKIKWTDILDLIEKEGWINRKTGESKILPVHTILPTDGNFYYKIFGFGNIIRVRYDPPEQPYDRTVGYWYVVIPAYGPNWVKITYKINGETGEFEKTEKPDFKFE